MSTVHQVRVEPLTEEAFAPFGQVVSAKDRPPDFETESGTQGWAVDFSSGRPLVMLLRTPYQGLRFSKLERHFNLTQTFLPLGGSPAVVAVAPPSSDRTAVPDPTDVRAFLLDGSKGYALARGTWHSLDRFPLYPPETRWVIITDHETQRDLLTAYSGQGTCELTQEVDYHARFGVGFALTLDRRGEATGPPEERGTSPDSARPY
ncbi:MAG TPA: ureidoglycolate lyase [Methylomirabilota bacterium]|jgi:ureidoglycolate lyase|nr:ureidoglycolate lyase [Methylomirabilota bacterium]